MQPKVTLSNIKQPKETFGLQLLIDKIKRDKGLDLSGYKESTIARRIERRIKFDGASSLEEYIQMIDRDYHLYWHLVSDFFIGVTDFFRDKEIWDVVREKVLPEIVVRRASCVLREKVLPEIVGRRMLDVGRDNDTSHVPRTTSHGTCPLRLWSACCSTGEETYSLAIAVKEVLRKEKIKDLPVFIYGTDIMEDKLEIAKEGVYSEEKLKDMDDNIKFRYFERSSCVVRDASCVKENNAIRNTHHAIRSDIRRTTRFRKYDLVKPETLAGFDMIVCRNVLIYFQRSLQEKVIKHFYRALRPEGILWLGKAESLSDETNPLFEPVCKNEKIFRKRAI